MPEPEAEMDPRIRQLALPPSLSAPPETERVLNAFQCLRHQIHGVSRHRARLSDEARWSLNDLLHRLDAEIQVFNRIMDSVIDIYRNIDEEKWSPAESLIRKRCGSHYGRYLDSIDQILAELRGMAELINLDHDEASWSIQKDPSNIGPSGPNQNLGEILLDDHQLRKFVLVVCSVSGAFGGAMNLHLSRIRDANDNLRTIDAEIHSEAVVQQLTPLRNYAETVAEVLGVENGFTCACQHHHVAFFRVKECFDKSSSQDYARSMDQVCSLIFHNTSSTEGCSWNWVNMEAEILKPEGSIPPSRPNSRQTGTKSPSPSPHIILSRQAQSVKLRLRPDHLDADFSVAGSRPLSVQNYFASTDNFVLSVEQKLQLAHKVASALFYLHSTPWLMDPWDSESIHLIRQDDGRTLIDPLLAKRPVEDSASVDRHDAHSMWREGVPTSIHLGRFLIELCYGATWDRIRTTFLSAEESSMGPIDADNFVFSRIDSWVGNPMIAKEEQPFHLEGNSYMTAVRSCFIYDFGQPSTSTSLYDEAFRLGVYTQILRPLQFALEDFQARQSRIFGPRRRHPDDFDNSIVPPRARIDSFKLFDDEDIKGDKGQKSKAADDWFLDYESVLRITRILRPARPKIPEDRVRVAILDTGVDIKHKNLHRLGMQQQIIYENFVPGGSPSVIYQDENGHGTHVTSILLKIAENVDVYVARISPDGRTWDSGQVANAIQWAVHKKRVHIISISFGFPNADQSLEPIRRAILDAHAADVLIFAATGNRGKRHPMAFPACLDEVISVSSTDGNNKMSDFLPFLGPGKRLCAIGEAIEAAWITTTETEKDRPHGTMTRRAGTSYATPVAAGVAAMVLDLVWPIRNEYKYECQTLRTKRGMLAVFGHMLVGEERDLGEYLAPWNLINNRDPNTSTGSDRNESAQKQTASLDVRDGRIVKTILATLRSVYNESWRR
ncbi:hypothetical protein LTR24_006889 [Lithohypha guttulata]|uniref:Peptidase S8/S53 domain-containing protein n=1 Tax=Lithohypha guttulata TaxID=1690604 RepID=A0ABR0K533_9EURO|nr:hypothetical protein LTR24_006889 [Lithohypha guttulata]